MVEEDGPRELSVLLSLGTYQGMTDEEIELVIAHKVQSEVTNSINLADIQMRTQAMGELVAQEIADQQSLSAMVQSLFKKKVFLETVEGNNNG